MEYIDSWYNRRQLHSNNHGLSLSRVLADYQDQLEQVAALEEISTKRSQKLDERSGLVVSFMREVFVGPSSRHVHL